MALEIAHHPPPLRRNFPTGFLQTKGGTHDQKEEHLWKISRRDLCIDASLLGVLLLLLLLLLFLLLLVFNTLSVVEKISSLRKKKRKRIGPAEGREKKTSRPKGCGV